MLSVLARLSRPTYQGGASIPENGIPPKERDQSPIGVLGRARTGARSTKRRSNRMAEPMVHNGSTAGELDGDLSANLGARRSDIAIIIGRSRGRGDEDEAGLVT